MTVTSASTKLGKKKRSPDGTMTIVEHLVELRNRLMVSLAAIVVTSIIGFMWYQHGVPGFHLFGAVHFPGIPSLGDILKEPYCSLPESNRATLSADGECRLLATSPFEMFMLRLKVGGVAGVVMACPVWMTEIWRFVTPGLLKNERRWTLSISTITTLLFVIGAVVAYWVLPFGLDVLVAIGDNVQVSAMTGHEYFTFVIDLMLIFGVSFEVPIFTAILNIFGIIHYDQLKDKRRIIIVTLFIFAAIATPGQDPVSMLVLACALVLLMEFALQFTRIHDKRRAQNRPEWADMDDDSASPLDVSTSPIDPAQPLGGVTSSGPISRPAPVTSSGSVGKSERVSAPSSIADSSQAVRPAPVSRAETVQASGSVRAGSVEASEIQSNPQDVRPSQVEPPQQSDGTIQGGYFDDVL